MPELDGWQTLERIRDLSDVPVAMLTARAAELEKARLKAGADDYITSRSGGRSCLPGSRRCCVVRVARGGDEHLRRLVGSRRLRSAQGQWSPSTGLLALTPLEFRLLAAFVRHPGQLLARPGAGAGLGRLVLGLARSGEALRRLPTPQARGRGHADGSVIETVRGFGYRYRP